MKENSQELKDAIQQEIKLCQETKIKHGYTETACVLVTKVSEKSRKLRTGFNFTKNVNVGDIINNDDGSISEVVSLV